MRNKVFVASNTDLLGSQSRETTILVLFFRNNNNSKKQERE